MQTDSASLSRWDSVDVDCALGTRWYLVRVDLGTRWNGYDLTWVRLDWKP